MQTSSAPAARRWQKTAGHDIIGTMWWRKLDRRQKLRRWAVALWTTPLILLFPMWIGLFEDPYLIGEYPSLYLLFFALPFAAAAILYWIAAREPEIDGHR